MRQVEQARCEADMPTISHIAHTLRSSSASVGALSFSYICRDIELQLRESRVEGLPALLDALQIESVRVQAALDRILAERGPQT
jgi:HPt (histidine-containing phosphotransfer) domain-containing protein